MAERILLVDDFDDFRGMVTDLLEAQGYQVVSVASGAEAEEAFAAQGPFDLLLTDFRMPGMNGLELADRLRRERPDLPVVVTSSSQDPRIFDRLAGGDIGLLEKPFSSSALRQELVRALEGAEPPVVFAARPPTPLVAVPDAAAGSSRTWISPALGAAAMVVLAVGLFSMLQAPSQVPNQAPPPLPEVPVEGPLRGARVELVSPRGDLAAAPQSLAWESVEGALGYRIRILAVDDRVLWEEVLSPDSGAAPALDLPDSVTDSLSPAVRYRWQVEALDAQGTGLATSAPVAFQILPKDRP